MPNENDLVEWPEPSIEEAKEASTMFVFLKNDFGTNGIK